MKNTQQFPIDLDTEQMAFLQQMAATYKLADAGKAIRCLINYARESPDKRPDIFEDVRCLEC